MLHGESNLRQDEVFVFISLNVPQTTKISTHLKSKLDSGKQGTILLMRIWRQVYPVHFDNHGKLKPGSLRPLDITLAAYDGSRIKHLGTLSISCSHRQKAQKDSSTFPFGSRCLKISSRPK